MELEHRNNRAGSFRNETIRAEGWNSWVRMALQSPSQRLLDEQVVVHRHDHRRIEVLEQVVEAIGPLDERATMPEVHRVAEELLHVLQMAAVLG